MLSEKDQYLEYIKNLQWSKKGPIGKYCKDIKCQFTDKKVQMAHKYAAKALGLTIKQENEHPNPRKHLQNSNQLTSLFWWLGYKLLRVIWQQLLKWEMT